MSLETFHLVFIIVELKSSGMQILMLKIPLSATYFSIPKRAYNFKYLKKGKHGRQRPFAIN